MNLIQSNENRKSIKELKSKLETIEINEEADVKCNGLKLSIRELGLKVIEYRANQGNQ
jgi:hypothetical protein